MQKKKIIILAALAVVLIGIIFINNKKSEEGIRHESGTEASTRQETDGNIYTDDRQTEGKTMKESEDAEPETEHETEGPERAERETATEKLEGEGPQGLRFELSQLESFMDESKIREVEERLMEIAPVGATKVTCMDYQNASQEEMNVVCYLRYDSGQVAELTFSFSQATFAVEMSSLTMEDIEALRESEAQEIQESEEKERKKAQRRLDKERRARESETETELGPETELPGQPEP